MPTVQPTVKPTVMPTFIPTVDPTVPTVKPTVIPTFIPTVDPTVPTVKPTVIPTFIPTVEPGQWIQALAPTAGWARIASDSTGRYLAAVVYEDGGGIYTSKFCSLDILDCRSVHNFLF